MPKIKNKKMVFKLFVELLIIKLFDKVYLVCNFYFRHVSLNNSVSQLRRD